ncbi:MAG: DNA-directed DNA polymerase I [Candidatus Atabeyarchaeum deiterrae]
MTKDAPTLDSYFKSDTNVKQERTPRGRKELDRKPSRQEEELGEEPSEEDASIVQAEEEESEIEPEGITGERYVADNTPPSILLSVRYDGGSGKAFAKLYDPEKQQLYFWYDNTGHLPYCFTDITPEEIKRRYLAVANHPGLRNLESVEKYDLLSDRKVRMTKITATDPLAIGGRNDSIRELIPDNVWEAKIPYHICYIYDRGLTPGMPYQIKEGKLLPTPSKIPQDLMHDFSDIFQNEPKEFRELLPRLLPYFIERTPDIRRVAVDIEVLNPIVDRIPDATTAEHRVFAVSLASNDGLKEVYLLRINGEGKNYQDLNESSANREFKVSLFDDEKDLLKKTFEILDDYPVVVTFNGDLFDLRYLAHRAHRLNIDSNEIPIILTKDRATVKYGEHIDLYRFFFNRSIQVYAFSNKYRDISLDTISRTLVGLEKVKLTKNFVQLSPSELSEYSWQDAKITFELTRFSGNIVLNLILLIMRLSHLPIEDVTRQAVSAWIRSLFYFEHRQAGYLIPRPQDISKSKGQVDTKAMIKGKKYMGAIVVAPHKGVHFNVAVLDFASLYPSIIKTRNLSYETVRCHHPECQTNKVPETTHWVCSKKRGISSLLIGFFRDVRVKWFKNKAKDKNLNKDERSLYDAVSQALKVFLNASYGVFGAETFPLYCPPVAESTTAVGRYAIMQTINKAKDMGVEVIYGDTDSVFLKNPSEAQISELFKWSNNTLGIELELDKRYRYLALSERKKNYLGVYEDGTVDIKGLTGKKRNTPDFLRQAFREMVQALAQVQSPQDFDEARRRIKEIARTCYRKLEKHEYSLEDLAFRIELTKELDAYKKTMPQHVKAANQLKQAGVEVRAGDIIYFVKVKGPTGVRPVKQASVNDIDVDKYKDAIQSTFEQVLDALGIEFHEIMGLTRIDAFY